MARRNDYGMQLRNRRSSSDEDEKQDEMDKDEANRMCQRYSNNDMFKIIQNANSKIDDKTMRLQHCVYVQLVGQVSNFPKQANSRSFQSEDIEHCLDKAMLYENAVELRQRREEYAVIEDDFGPALTEMLMRGNQPSFKNLVTACRKFDQEVFIQKHIETTERSHGYFIEKKINKDEAQAYAFAIAFYTGVFSEMVNINANLHARRWQRSDATENAKVDDNAAMIMYYLITGLSHIKFFWGRVVRYVTLTPEDLADYKPGEIITWLQFSSTDKGDDKSATHLQWCKGRNTKFIVWSLTGRSIRNFSNCSKAEDEVLFMPHSTFLVCHVEVVKQTNHIYMRQVSISLIMY